MNEPCISLGIPSGLVAGSEIIGNIAAPTMPKNGVIGQFPSPLRAEALAIIASQSSAQEVLRAVQAAAGAREIAFPSIETLRFQTGYFPVFDPDKIATLPLKS